MSHDNKRNLYEGIYIIRPNLSDEAKKRALEKITSGILATGGEIVKLHEIGRKRLAYDVENCSEGFYYLIYFQQYPGAIDHMWLEYQLHEDLLRFMTIRAHEVKETVEFKPLVKQ